jgi:hypothetical protein
MSGPDDRLVELLLPPLAVPSASALEGARRTAQRRFRILRDYGALSASDLAERAGSSAENRSQLAYSWRRQKRIVAVRYRGALVYPAFQFDADHRPLPAVRAVLDALDGWPAWEIVEWFVTDNPLLDLRRPVELLAADADEAVFAARYAARRE